MRKLIHSLAITATIASYGLFGQSGFAQEKYTPKTEVHTEASNTLPIAFLTTGESATSDVAGGGVHPDAPAPPLTQLVITNVCSTATCENISVGQTATAVTYTGTTVDVFVWEIGYGNGEIATQGGFQLTSSYLVAKQAVCQSGNQYVTPCANGQTVAGWRYEWSVGSLLNQNYGENFTAADTSEVSPYNHLSVGLTIRYTH